MMFLLFGRMTTCWALVASTASRICAVDGFIDWPPVRTWAPSEWKIRRMPSPVAMATTAVVTGVASGSGSGCSTPSRTHRSSSTSSSRSVTRIFEGLPISMAASMAGPMSSVWMWQLNRPSPPTTTIESPMPAHTSLKAPMASSGASRMYMTS